MRAFGTSDASSVQPSEIQVLAKTHARRNKYEYLFRTAARLTGRQVNNGRKTYQDFVSKKK